MTTRRQIGNLAWGAVALAGVVFVAAFLVAWGRPAATEPSYPDAAAAPTAREAVESRPPPGLGRAAALPAIRVERPAPRRAAPAPPAPAPSIVTSASQPPSPAPAAPAPPTPPIARAPPPAPVADPPAAATPAPTFDSSGEHFDSSG